MNDTAATADSREKVVIIGGGCGGVAAAFWLTSTAALRARFKVTLYTLGWRLGGKCASGRNAMFGDRIEEHGLHIWMGFYQNAFRTIQAAYQEWMPPANSPFKVWTDAFSPERRVVLEQSLESGWAPWCFTFPCLPGTPGDANTMSLNHRVAEMSYRLRRHFDENLQNTIAATIYRPALDAFRMSVDADLGLVQRIEARLLLRTAHAALHLAMRDGRPDLRDDVALDFRRLCILADLGLAIVRGYVSDIFGTDPSDDHQAAYDALNAQDFRAWLRANGASDDTLASPLVTCIYDLAFAYPDGDASAIGNGSIAAGVTLRFLEYFVLQYKDAPLWRMNAGMGDAVFAPLHDVLVARGVTVNFFHRLTEVVPSADKSRVETVHLARQADLIAAPYRPIVTVRDLRCWPSAPDWKQLVGGECLRRDGVNFESNRDTTRVAGVPLQAGIDFDHVVLAVPPEVLKLVTPALAAANADWDAMLTNSASVMTQAAQLWLSVNTDALKCPFPAAPLTCYAEPFDTYCDMSHLLPMENWPAQNAPQAIAYFCGTLQGTLPPGAGQIAQAGTNETEWLSRNIRNLWPGVVDASGQLNAGVVTSTYLRANDDPSELYVQTPPGSVAFRLAPDSRVFGNLYLAGDWTWVSASGGCVENAIEAGMIVAQAISGVPMPVGI